MIRLDFILIIKCNQIKAKIHVITTANHNRGKHQKGPMRTQSRQSSLAYSARKIEAQLQE